jgi:hypothetical protein
MVIALIVLGVVVFLAVDAYIVYRIFAARRRAADYGVVPVPGEATLMLPVGTVRLRYQESYKAKASDDDIDFGVPPELEVTVSAAGGEPLAVKGPGFRGMGESLDTGGNWSRALIGTIAVAEAGEYTVRAGAVHDGAVEPRILVGRP